MKTLTIKGRKVMTNRIMKEEDEGGKKRCDDREERTDKQEIHTRGGKRRRTKCDDVMKEESR